MYKEDKAVTTIILGLALILMVLLVVGGILDHLFDSDCLRSGKTIQYSDNRKVCK